MPFDPPKSVYDYWECWVCRKKIVSDKDGLPTSKYWNDERKEVYCSAEHSLERHEEIKHKTYSTTITAESEDELYEKVVGRKKGE